jgi:hypothetical protein
MPAIKRFLGGILGEAQVEGSEGLFRMDGFCLRKLEVQTRDDEQP